ncbi:MAG: prephenate dehydrogenase/arogenate dehydrogenase family protein [Candidatus Bathyarchaeota archaeon]|uniref:prephenate dehydrogenase/arogenate dehydrogenase family protein n=1 Tax=Candidatus Bathycorpusculum sp. TaxID=2994959 RepID=UPI00281ED8C0|nr:prephenate dehydrogenase/arogenate dehydrogenase family protein [Candidatus Termiticorpusculum sp.]MCL2256746.1 prephenate dehydrogenase/arogenate dehydrogenase family protein [Candidatus Termiticorpusculum sp.]MCL2293059.1 prephenate dehydrogenase/arogenate dehydrogenase family protein [Candidatus Termiticorpusculum sp.]
MRIAILGAGKMGIWFAKFYKEKGDTIILAGRSAEKLAKLKEELQIETTLNFQEAVQKADNILICTSISSFEEVIKKIAPFTHKGQTIMDICSIKEHPVNIMHQHIKDATILGTHPVFGPGSNGVEHKAYVLTPTNLQEETAAEQHKQWLEKEGANVFIMTPKKHDDLMSIILGLPHFIGLIVCETLLEQKDYTESKKLAGTTYRMLFTLAEATAQETPDLYANVQTKLSDLGKIEELFIQNAQTMLDLMKNKDTIGIMTRMERLQTKLAKMDKDYGKSYETMYKMLQSTEEQS